MLTSFVTQGFLSSLRTSNSWNTSVTALWSSVKSDELQIHAQPPDPPANRGVHPGPGVWPGVQCHSVWQPLLGAAPHQSEQDTHLRSWGGGSKCQNWSKIMFVVEQNIDIKYLWSPNMNVVLVGLAEPGKILRNNHSQCVSHDHVCEGSSVIHSHWENMKLDDICTFEYHHYYSNFMHIQIFLRIRKIVGIPRSSDSWSPSVRMYSCRNITLCMDSTTVQGGTQ